VHVCHLCVTSACLLCGFCVLCGLSVMCLESYVGHIVVASMWLWDYCVLGILFLSIVYGFFVFYVCFGSFVVNVARNSHK